MQGLPQDTKRRAEKQARDDGADDNVRPARGKQETAACGQQDPDVGDQVISRAQPSGTHVQVVATVVVQQEESSEISGKCKSADDPHRFDVWHDGV